MRPGKYDLVLYRGDSYGWQFKVWEDADKLEPADLTGVVARAQIRATSAAAAATELECSVTLPNIVDMALPAELWATVLLVKGLWDLELTYPGGAVVTILYGAVAVTADVTH